MLSMPFKPRIIVAVASVAMGPTNVTTELVAQVLTRTSLAWPERVLGSGLLRVSEVRELPGRRVVALDSEAGIVVLIDPSRPTPVPLSRQGSGPGEYAWPSRLFQLPNGRIGVMDGARSYILVFNENGVFEGQINARWDRACKSSLAPHLRPAQASDQEARLYAQSEPIRIVRDLMQVAESAAVERWTAPCIRDTLGFVPNRFGSESMIVSGFVVGRPGSLPVPYEPTVQWAVSQDGLLAMVFPKPYHVETVTRDGRHRAGPPVLYDPIRITEGIKQQWREAQESSLSLVRGRDGSRSRSPISPPPDLTPIRWPEYLPPFLPDAVRWSPQGRLWVMRATRPGQPVTYDVFDGKGFLVEQVEFLKESRVVGFGDEGVYVARVGADATERIELYHLSKP